MAEARALAALIHNLEVRIVPGRGPTVQTIQPKGSVKIVCGEEDGVIVRIG
jgi:hypothetical protein